MPQMKSVEKTLMMAFAGAIAASFCCGLSVTPSVDKELANALAYGADAAINVCVHDEQNHPITGACVRCGFWLQTANLSPAVYGKTDNTGHFVAKAKCNDDVTIVVKCDGYYGATVRKVMTKITTDPKVINGRWHPYGIEIPVEMRKIVNPVSLEHHFNTREIEIPATNQWFGFDLKKDSLVKPFGDGEQSDFEFKFDWNGRIRGSYNGSAFSVRFNEKCAGGDWSPLVSNSVFRAAMSADVKAKYNNEFAFFTRKDGGRWEESLFGSGRTLIVRSRCQIDEDGSLKSAIYSQIYSLAFGWGSKGHGWFTISYDLNPYLNDSNLEADWVEKSMKKMKKW